MSVIHHQLWIRIAFFVIWIPIIIYSIVSPFTKVEESFNIQAIHDILFHGFNVDAYDHLEFPGVVPRTFIGPIIVSSIVYPFKVLFYDIFGVQKIIIQYITRIVIGSAIAYSLHESFWKFWERRFFPFAGLLVNCTNGLICFHLMYYASRPLPNVFALFFVNLAMAAWFEDRCKTFVTISVFVVVVFRFESIIFLVPWCLISCLARKITFKTAFITATVAFIASFLLTVIIDSYFWRRFCWPEYEVMHFNIIQNKSSYYGVEPFWWYFNRVLPKMLGFNVIFLLLGIVLHKSFILYVLPVGTYLLAFSTLPHKETRFIFYIVPTLTIISSVGMIEWFKWSRSLKDRWLFQVFQLLPIFVVGAQFLVCLLFLQASAANYPGGDAGVTLSKLIASNEKAYIHIDNLAAQTGFNRFMQDNPHWNFSKEEAISSNSAKWKSFTHRVAEGDCELFLKNSHPVQYKVLHEIDTFDQFVLDKKFPFFIKIHKKPALCILKVVMK